MAGAGEADAGLQRVFISHPPASADLRNCRSADKAYFPRPGIVRTEEVGPEQTEVCYLQVPDHGAGCGMKSELNTASDRSQWPIVLAPERPTITPHTTD